ncbi:MAG: ABC transporter ATP-binding protein [Anaerolineae bacterium]|nr:ABC transporter ATP-binding protein [Anaerolineae bacterium]
MLEQRVTPLASENNHTPSAVHLRIDQVVKRFGNTTAVDGVSLEIPKGAFATLLGPSGCGKTTLLRMIAGFYDPDGGVIYLNDQRIDQLPAHKRGTAMVFQDYALFPHMRVAENVGYGLQLAGLPKAEIARRVADTLEFVGMSGLGDRWPNQLSGGQQQRVALARALVVEPQVLLLDEPLSNLDANLRERMRWELRALQQKLNITFLYVTHDQAEALAMSDWVAVMNGGRVEQWGSPWDIYYHPRTAFMAGFVGSANLQPATVVQRDTGTLTVTLHDHRLSIPAPQTPVESDVLLCIRPETLTIDTAPRDPTCVSLSGVVARRAFLGHIMRYWVQIGQDEWIVDQSDPGMIAQAFDGPVVISLQPERVHVINPHDSA